MPDAGRVIAGSAAGRRLLAPGPATRPLGDRVKQTLFAILEPELRGARMLDLFAGSGGAGIEALSRGASLAVFVERDPEAVRTIRENLRRVGFGPDRAIVVQAEAMGWLRRPERDRDPFDVVLVDPPYVEGELMDAALGALGDPGARLLAPGARVVAKHFWRTVPPEQIGLLGSDRSRRFGETALTFYRLGAAEPTATSATPGPSRGES